ncbi:Predicted oxidoreductase [Methylobacterium sp. ap11]|jgi:aryl-alcohol dehydrogenase-like predicted oxidoreductase|uniref:aldo/keto reductase n=1 Tax=Methylobacterium sp. ap11 TaxID=1761799 RepID=UPI0008BACF46|nr:aldo/keto reductase [Methylobacterium sp. ap11]SEP43730.1 Predicted oxidoreductase [Methylobacterium sp. ap11]
MMLHRRAVLAGSLAASLVPSRLLAQGDDLIRRPIPSTGETVPAIGIGTSRRYDVAPDSDAMAPLRETVARFVALGGTVIDTAPDYGRAEEVLGRILQETKLRDKVFLCSKVAARGREAGEAQIAQSFRRLGTDRIDLIAVHNLIDPAVQLPLLREMKAQKRIRYLGATTWAEGQYGDLEALMKAEKLDVIQVNYAVDARKAAERILPLARERGIAVMVNVPFGRERLFNLVRGRELPPFAAEFDCRSWPQFFLKYVLSHEAVTCPVPGTAQVRYAEDNLGAARGRLPDAALRRKMEEFIDGL